MNERRSQPLSAGAVPELPVVAWLHELTTESYREASITSFSETDPWVDALKDVGHGVISSPLALRAPAQATIHAQAAEIERLKASLEALNDLTAGSMEQLRQERDKLRKDETSEPYAWFWQDGSETGVLTLRQDFESHAAKYPHMRFTPVWSTPRKSLKAKQVAEAAYGTNNGPVTPELMAVFKANIAKPRDYIVRPVAEAEEAMRLADEWVVEAIHAALSTNTGHATLADPEAAREALRAFLTKDRT